MFNAEYFATSLYAGQRKRSLFRTQQEYFQKAVQYLRKSVDGLTAADITGLWLSTDEDAVYNEVGCLAVLRGHGFSRCQGCFSSVDLEYTNRGIQKTPCRGRKNGGVVETEVLAARHLDSKAFVRRCELDEAMMKPLQNVTKQRRG